MTVFIQFIPAASVNGEKVPAGPLEFFPSIPIALAELKQRGAARKGHRALVSAVPEDKTLTWKQWQRANGPEEFPQAREGAGGWVARVWWRKSGEPIPAPGDPVGEFWLSAGEGVVDRNRRDSSQWQTGHARRVVAA